MTLARLAAEAGIALNGEGEATVTGFAIDHRKVAGRQIPPFTIAA